MVKAVDNKEEYEKLYNQHHLSFLQTWQWGIVKEPAWKPLRLAVNNYPVTILLRRIPISGRSFAYIPRLLSDDDFSADILKEIVQYLKSNAKLSHIIYDPGVTDKSLQAKLNNIGFTADGPQLQLDNTNIIDLSIGTEELLASFKSQTRNKINKPEKLGCKVQLFDKGQEALDRFWEIMKSIVQNTTYVSHDKAYFQKMWNQFSPINMAKIFIMYQDSQDLGCYFVLHNNDTLWELFGGLNTAGREIRGAGYFLKWESIRKAAEIGIKNYDQWGVAPKIDGHYDKSHALANISEFKELFNGKHVEYLPQQILIVDNLSYKVFKAGEKIQTLIVKMKKLVNR